MGTIKAKLDYLEETKRLIREKLKELGAEVTDEDTFRSYVEKMEDANGVGYIGKAVLYNVTGSEPETITDIIGEYSLTKYYHNYIPRTVYPDCENADGSMVSVVLPFTGRSGGGNYAAVNIGSYWNFQRVKAPDNFKLRVYLNMWKPATLILPERVDLVQYTLYNGSSGTDSNSFTRGLGFGQSVADSVSTWINRTLSTTKRVVKFPPGFKMDSGSTLYLSKIYITQACMQEMVQNLYDYIGNGETTEVTRTISVGSTNRALLTAAEIQLAKDKGWNIAV